MNLPPADPSKPKPRLLSIGAVGRSSGLSEATLRVWERRYGIPSPVRLPSGHRRYRPEQVRHLRLVAEALAQGSRPGEVLKLSIDELSELVASGRKATPAEDVQQAIRDLDEPRLVALLEAAKQSHGLLPFLDDFIAPLLAWVGQCWARGDLQIKHEQLLTRSLEALLAEAATTFPDPSPSAPRLLLASLPDERHVLGLGMVGLLCRRSGVEHQILAEGASLEQIAQAAREFGAQALALSIPVTDQGAALYRKVDSLRELLDDSILLFMGGEGVRRIRRSPSGVERLGSLAALESRLQNLPPSSQASASA